MLSIRPVDPDDLDALYEVCLRTGDAGEDAIELYDDPRLLGEVYVGPYLTMPGGIGLTAVEDGIPSGYALAAIDTRSFEAECEIRWWPPLRARYPDPGPDPSTADQRLSRLIHDPPRASDDVVALYPAHLHLDLLPSLQGRGVGRVMMSQLLDELVDRGAVGVHLGADPRNSNAVGFYSHLGFVTLSEGAEVVMMGLRLDS